jgi:hypothetical protein
LFDGSRPAKPFALFLDTRGHIIGRKETYDVAGSFSEGLAGASIQEKCGFVDIAGELVMPAIFDLVASYHEGLCAVRIGGAWEFIDRRGRVVAKGGRTRADSWNEVGEFHGGLARVHVGGEFHRVHDGPSSWQGGKWMYINRQGTIIANCCKDGDGEGIDALSFRSIR